MFFSFDGVDGAGKSTQLARFSDWLGSLGHEVVLCRDPGTTAAGEALRGILLEKSEMNIHPRTEMLMYMSARAQLVEEMIRPAIAAGKIVISDRYLLANIVYQGHARGLDPAEIRSVGEVAVGGLMPSATFVFDLPVEVAMTRMSRTLDRMESSGSDFMERVRQGFLTESRSYPGAIVVDASPDVETVQAELRRLATPLLVARC